MITNLKYWAPVGIMVFVLLFIAFLIGASTASAAPPTVSPAVGTTSESVDYPSYYFADPWDYANAEDFILTENVQSSGVENMAMSDGALSFDIAPSGFIQPVYSGAMPHNRDEDIHPLIAEEYTHLSFRMYSSLDYTVAGGIFWFDCWGSTPDCQGAMSFALQPGWNTYDLYLSNTLGGIPWSGEIKVLRIMPTSSVPAHIEVDWMRLHQPGDNVDLTVQGGWADEVWWDSDSDPNNNNGSSGAGLLASWVPDGSTVSFPASSYPPGTYRFYTKQGGQVSSYSSPLVVDARPEPVVIDPDIAGGDDYATVVRGDPWDFEQYSDGSVYNSTALIWEGLLKGGYAGPAPYDPQVNLSMPEPIDASLYHRLTYRIHYDGPFDLGYDPGGGMVARVIWSVVQNGVPGYHDSQDMIIFPGWQTVSVDLKTNPPSEAEDESSTNPIGWGGPASGWVSSFRFDPHEDPGGRVWHLDYVRLCRNDRGDPYFDIEFQDNAWEAGTTAEIWVDNDNAGYNGTQIASGIDVTEGANTYRWNGNGVGEGTWWVYVVLTDADGTVTRTYSTGPVDMPATPVNPFGSMDSQMEAPDGLRVSGWAIDPDTADPIDVHLYLDGQPAVVVTANEDRPDIGDAFPESGSLHGFTTDINAGPGTHTVCAYGINVGAGGNALIECSTATVSEGNPFGNLDSVSIDAGGNLDTAGWAIDPNTGDAIDVQIYVNSRLAATVTANGDRPDVESLYPPYGAQHGFTTAPPLTADESTVCAYGVNTGAGANALLGCATVQNGWDSYPTSQPPAGRHYYWTWYDNIGGSNWVLMANPVGGSQLDFDLNIKGMSTSLSPFGGPGIAAGSSIAADYGGLIGGPVVATSTTGGSSITSQRILWGPNQSLEELPGMDESRLSSHYYWTWYDNKDAMNWVMISNPLSETVTAEIIIGGASQETVDIAAGQSYNQSYENLQTGPVEIKAYRQGGDWTVPGDRRTVMASQRVLFYGGLSFNEVAGTPEEELSDDYLWTWYDDKDGMNWVMAANPLDETVTVDVYIGDLATPIDTFDIIAGECINKHYPGLQTGPVEMKASLKSDGSPANIVASLRSVWGSSFEEVPGFPRGSMTSTYHWTFYDNVGGFNWVMVSNPNESDVYAEIYVGSDQNPKWSGEIAAGEEEHPMLGGISGGPVRVEAYEALDHNQNAPVLASQRVLWNGNFNEMQGTILE